MNCILRYVVLPWRQLSGMGNWSYGVITEWVDRSEVKPGSTPPEIFTSADEAKDYARNRAAEWPYRAEACFLNDSGKYLPLESHT
jgi:hypothetical protein